jgi:predicted transposase YbfD/YdcC
LLSAFLHKQGIVIAQQAVDIKSNEITALRPLLADLDITGCVVTADALHTQKDAARFIVEEKHADYLFTVKDNQPTLREDIENLDIEAFSPCTPNRGQGPRPT